MKRGIMVLTSLPCLVLSLILVLVSWTGAEEIYFGFEMQGNLVGYLEVVITPAKESGSTVTVIRSELFAKMTLLGQDFDLKVEEVCHIDPATEEARYLDTTIVMGEMNLGSTAVVKDGKIHFTSKAGGAPKTLEMTPDLVFNNPVSFPYLARDLAAGRDDEKWEYQVFDATTGEIHALVCTPGEPEKLELAGKTYRSVPFDMLDRNNGVQMRVWLHPENGRFLKMTLPTGGMIYLAEPSVVGMIKRAELDDAIFGKVDLLIADYRGITYMKVKARIRSMGEWITAESLNVTGQRFEGTVEDNLIDGVFEIEHARYDGAGAPPFPTDFGGDESLKAYLGPEEMIEADDPVLREKAEELTRGAGDCWEAACRLSKWVGEEVSYKIPGGTARQTFDTLKGECGSHSRLLAAFCRSVGIPAKLATGCMYTPLYGGSFGQHVWNEIYMGGAGWITVDSTAMEFEYVDSGHIRLGVKSGFSPEEMEVVDYRTAAMEQGGILGLDAFRQAAWKEGDTATFAYHFDGKPLGTETYTVEGIEMDGMERVLCGRTGLKLQGRTTGSTWWITDTGRPVRYELEGQAGNVKYSISCAFSEGQVVEKVVQAGQTTERTIPLKERVCLLDNNHFSLFALLIAGLPLEEGRIFSFKTFHPSSMQVLPVEITVKGRDEASHKGEKHPCWKLEFVLAGHPIEMWVDEKGRILKETEQGGRLVLELQE